ncbi:MAG: hypothetical protein H6836_01420 [Planctomycetes bacterium]|nr:hypothetical protein [Planctomycetota bacterium]
MLCWRHRSTCLAGNPLGDPAERRVYVYLPPGRGEHDCAGLPALFLLPGFVGRGRGMLADNLFAPAIDDRMNRLIAAGCPPAVLVLVDCSTRLGGSQYLDSPAVGHYQEYLAEELVALVRERLGVGPLGVAGKSSGGFGALRVVMDRPGTFAAAACHSGDCYFEYGYLPDIPKAAAAIARAGSVNAFLDQLSVGEKKSSEQIITLSMVAMAACYSPQADGGYQLPFDPNTGAFREDVFARWLEHDPYRRVADHLGALRALQLLFIDVGTRDEYHLQLGARLLHRRLGDLEVPHHYEEFDDGHFGTSYRYDTSIPALVRALTGGR